MISTSRAYNALTGAELKQTILAEVERALDKANINSAGISYPGVSWSWSLTVRQRDNDGRPMGEDPERKIEAGKPSGSSDIAVEELKGGSKRFRHDPPSPTEVRQSQGLPVPEA